MTGHGTEVKSSFLHQNHKFARDEAFFPRATRGPRPREEEKATRFHQKNVVARHIDDKPLFSPKASGSRQKPWPNKVPVQAEELVKHMSNIPGYLQRIHRGDDLQDKALNFGVLGWQHLKKWTDSHNDKAAVSPASSNSSSAFSAFGLSSKSCRSTSGKHVACSNQSPSLNLPKGSSSKHDSTLISEKETSRRGMGHHTPEITWSEYPIRCHLSASAKKCPRMDCLAAKLEGNKGKCLDSNAVSDDVGHFSCVDTMPSRSKDLAASHSINAKLKTLNVESDHREKFGESGHECLNSLSTVVDHQQYHHSEPTQLNDTMLDSFRESAQGSRRFSFGSTESGYTMQPESGRTSFSGIHHCEHFQLSAPNVLHSSALTSDIHRSEWSNVNACVHEHGEGSEDPNYSTNSPARFGELATGRSNGQHENIEKPAIQPHTSFATKTLEHRPWNGVRRVITKERESIHTYHSHGGLNAVIGSSKSREASATKPKWTSPSNYHNGDKTADNSRARRSPLRRLLDPLLKPKGSNQIHTARLAAGTSEQPPRKSRPPKWEELPSTRGLQSSGQVSTHSYANNSVEGCTYSRSVPIGNHISVHDKKNEILTEQTLLQLAWKNGLPLFTFSVNETDILAATRKKATSGKEECECIYTFYYICETKKKNGSWINQGNKSKRKGLVSSVVGQMNVSRIKFQENHFAAREFVLLGPELRPSVHGSLEDVPNSELAAIVVKVPEDNVEKFIGDLPPKNNCGDPLKINLQKDKYAFQPMGIPECVHDTEKNAPKMVAILPTVVHGLSDRGKPSTLVDRWKSQGLCDCGGWDAGCSLRILTNDLGDSTSGSFRSCYTTDGTHRVELFIQGVGQESRPVFSLVVFKEGLYTIGFHACIAPLQAFAVCIAILHGRQSTGLRELQNLH
uniref:Protein translocase subunit SecA n=1 Tax=Anthurium amnicola TaxID=1678845 RepID=A0A1D1YRY4_9ARAE